jgi:DnaK suppressor protein
VFAPALPVLKENPMSTLISLQSTASGAIAATWEQFRVLLEEQRAVCVREREMALIEGATSMPDPVAMRRAAGMLRTIDEIDTALDRIADGTYGRCTHCGVAIPVERLTIRPFAAGCVACQPSVR